MEEPTPSGNTTTAEADQDGNLEASEEEDEGAKDEIQGHSDEDEDETEGKDQNEQFGCVRVIENVQFDFEENTAGGRSQPLLGLVLTPTRELAVQVKHHIDAVATFTGELLLISFTGNRIYDYYSVFKELLFSSVCAEILHGDNKTARQMHM